MRFMSKSRKAVFCSKACNQARRRELIRLAYGFNAENVFRTRKKTKD